MNSNYYDTEEGILELLGFDFEEIIKEKNRVGIYEVPSRYKVLDVYLDMEKGKYKVKVLIFMEGPNGEYNKEIIVKN